MADNLSSFETEEVEDISKIIKKMDNYSHVSLETLVLLVNMERLKHLRDKTNSEFDELKKRQDQVSFLHKLNKAINAALGPDGDLDVSSKPELKKMLAEGKAMGVDMKEDKDKYSKEERERLIDNVKMTIDDLQVLNDMQLQTVNRLTNERYESYQLARSILKPLHDAKMQAARAISR